MKRRFLYFFLGLCVAILSSAGAWGDVVISEFLANNNTGLVDEDGQRSDWIELYNNGTTAENLAGWHLTDDAGEPERWTLPAVILEPRGFLVIFASAKDRVDPASALHTNFKLSSSGGYLALFRSDGTTATEYNPYPAQYDDRPYGYGQTVATTTLVGPTASLRYFVPTSATPDNPTWTAPAFNAGAWPTGANGVGFEITVTGWAFKTYFANTSIGDLTQAEGVIANTALQSSVQQANHPVINFDNTVSPGHYTTENPPAWLAPSAGDMERYVVEGTGTITVPSSGPWTFCVSSDDGCSLQIRPVGGTYTTVLSYPGLRGMGDSIGVYNFPSAGQYEIRAIVFENGGGSGGEVSARAGSVGTWDGSFKLIGDTANGGLAIQSLPVGVGGSGYGQFIGTSVKSAMYDAVPKKSSCYVRYTFSNPGNLTSLSMPIRYDDGIAVYLNGTLVASRNAPASLTNTSVATDDQAPSRAKQQEVINLTPNLGLLTAGAGNILAIHGLNEAANNGDFLLKGELYQYTVTTSPTANFYTTPTPGGFNTSTVYNKVAPVVASVQRGFYTSPQSVTLSNGTVGATIRYTFDGSTPVETAGSSATYTGPITINKTTTLRYRAFKAGSDASDSATQTYLFTSDVITQSPTGAAPVIANPPGATQVSTTWPGTSAGNGKYTINSQELDFGMDPDVVNNPAYSGTIQNDLKAIPTFSIVTDLGNLFDVSTGIYANPGGDGLPWERAASIELINPDGTVGFQANCGLRLRGGYSRSTGNPKHAFRLFFRDSYGPSKLNYPLFGDDPTGTDEFDRFDLRCAQNYSWSFGGDGSGNFVQDPLARDQQIAMGHPSSHGGFYHLYVNGHYWGLFNIDERPDGNFGSSYLGGLPENFDSIKVDPDLGYNIEATDGDLQAWTLLWQLADTGLSAANTPAANNLTYQRMLGCNPDGTRNPAYPVLLDPVNTIDSMLVVYWGGNTDAQISAFLSNTSPNNTYFLRDRTGASGGFRSVLHDSEHTLRNVNENRLGPWPAGNSNGGGGLSKSTPQYIFQQCMHAAEFRALVADRVQRHLFNNGVLTPATAMAMFDARAAQIDRAVVAESARWGDSKVGTPFTRTDWLNACNSVRSGFIPSRTSILLSQLRAAGWHPSFDPPVFSQRGGTVASGSTITISFAAGTPGGSTIYYTTDGTDPRAFGGGVSPTAKSHVSGATVTINASQLIRVRTRNGVNWSGIDEAAFYVLQDFSPLAITEIHYNPLPSVAGGNDGTDFEFVEFKNTGTAALDMGGVSFSSGLTYTFPAGTTIAPGGFFVLVKNATKFAQRYPGVTIGGVFTNGSLDNTGEKLALVTTLGGTVLSMTYDDDAPWPATADGSGFSLAPAGSIVNSDSGNDWRACANVHGSPGADDPQVNFPPIKVSEALTNSVLPLTDTIELHNPTGAPVNIGDWWLSDDRDRARTYRIPAGTTIPAGGYVAFNESQFNAAPGTPTSFLLNSNGDSVYLFSGDAAGNLTGYSHGWEVDASEPDVSFGRHVNSVGEEHFVRQTARTFGAVNAGPLVGPLVINEVMYHPFSGYDEYVEIRNLDPAPVSLDGPGGTTWRLAGMAYNFPAGQVVPGNGYALVVGIDPTAFRSKYGVPANVPIFGPFAGVLQDSGERLALEKPGTPYLDNGVSVTPYIMIDSLRYNDKVPWPTSADGEGPALQRLVGGAYADDPANWFASGATPGLANSVNEAPTVTLTGPASGVSYTVPATVNFTANASDSDGTLVKVEFYVNGNKVGEDETAPYAFAWPATGGVHTCTAMAIDNSLGFRRSEPITILVTTPVTQGLRADYYANRFLTAPVAFSRTDARVNFSDANNAWVNFGGVGVDQFSVRWTGQVRPLTSGSYTFYTMSDDGVRLFVNGQTLVDNWTDHGPTENSGTVTLTAGQLYTITMEFFENAGGAVAQLSWTGPGVGKQIIAQSALYPDSSPIITNQPGNAIAEAGTSASFSVTASGIGNQYQWRRNTVNIPGANSATLQIPTTILQDAGVYTCIISNTSGFAISNGATLTVTFTDTDGDGMQNSWETANGLNPNSPDDATTDNDGDGRSNRDESVAGTNPNDPNDYLQPSIVRVENGWKISFVARHRKSYVIQYRDTMSALPWTQLQFIAEQSGAERNVEVIDPSANGRRFYRVVTPGE